MSNDYLWDRSGPADPDAKQIEELLAPIAHDAPLDELRLAKGRRGEPVRATAHEPVAEPPSSGRVKGKMNFFDKRIIGAAGLIAAASGLFAITTYKRHVDAPPHDEPALMAPSLGIARAVAQAPHFAPVAPTTGADLAITAGESAWIHVPVGTVDVEIQSACNAEVKLSLAMLLPGPTGDRPTTAAEAKAAERSERFGLIAGTDRADGRATTYHLTPSGGPQSNALQYTSRCVGQPPLHGLILLDREQSIGPIEPTVNARVFNDADAFVSLDNGIRLTGTVLPGARVSIGATPVALEPVDRDGDDPLIDSGFAVDVPVTRDHLVAALRVDDAFGTHFYVAHPSEVIVESCASLTKPRQAAAKLDAQGDHAGALRTFQTAMAHCKPDRDTLSLGLTYACKAGDLAAARIHWRKLPTELQRTLEPVCAQNQITRDALDRP